MADVDGMIHTQDADFTLIQADVLDGLRSLEDGSVHCVVTSPPYWGLRDYGTGLWAGGDANCDHRRPPRTEQHSGRQGNPTGTPPSAKDPTFYESECRKCGATRTDQQLGLEATPDLYVHRIVEVFREVRRVLRADGTCWVNLGDSYAGGGGYAPDAPINQRRAAGEDWGKFHPASVDALSAKKGTGKVPGLKPKDLVGIPWRVAFALQADGWYLRSDIIWSKPNPMPESVTDRPTKAHEYVFLLSKSARYFFDQEAVREALNPASAARYAYGFNGYSVEDKAHVRYEPGQNEVAPNGRNVRSVWDIATQPYPEAHFATYPEELVRRCVLAGCPEDGTVLDPFLGSGTTAYVARKHGRRSIGIELNPAYCDLAARRMQQQSLLV